MKKTYKISDEKFIEAKNIIRESGGTISEGGGFEIKGVKGSFYLDGGNLTVIITDKPWLASWSMIEDKLDEFFN